MAKPKIGITVVVRRGEHILLGKRMGAHAAGFWATPGGHLELWESFEAAAARELSEEVGGIKTTPPRYLTTNNLMLRDCGKHYVDIVMVCDWVSGDPFPKELDRCVEWLWFPWRYLPPTLFPGIQSIVDRLWGNISWSRDSHSSDEGECHGAQREIGVKEPAEIIRDGESRPEGRIEKS